MARFKTVSPILTWLLLRGCEPPLDTRRQTEPYASFGAAVYREACQRVAYIGQLEQKEAGKLAVVDAEGELGEAVCVVGAPAPADSPEKLQEIQRLRQPLISVVD